MSSNSTFGLNGALSLKPFPRLSRLIERVLERIFALDALERRYRTLPRAADADEFLGQALDVLRIGYEVPPQDLAHVPVRGPAIVVANHPFGAVEGMVLARLLRRVRPDARVLANHFLARIPELADILIPVDPFSGRNAIRANVRPLRAAVRWVQRGGLLLVFPAGAVSHLQLPRGRVTDPPWSPSIGRVVALTRAPVLPAYVHGANSALFQVAGLLHPRLRTALLPRELLGKAHTTLRLRIGPPIPGAQLKACRSDAELVNYLRMRTYLLAEFDSAGSGQEPARTARPPAKAPMAPATPRRLLRAEVEALPAEQRLAVSGRFTVHYARAPQIPWCLQEIGRLRELTFRAAGEGTGKASDIDLFDAYYLHLFVWDGAGQEIVGAYRLGRTDEILARYGKRGLYTHSLFKYRRQALERMDPGIELGRSFVRAEHQRSYAPLMLLWRGIGEFIARSPRYAVLFGAVSISGSYAPLSRRLLVDFLEANTVESSLARHVRPRRPFRARRPAACDDGGALRDIEEVSRLVAQIERDDKGIPILLRQYLKLGGRLLGFSADPAFSDALDGLIVVDLRSTDPRLLARYMGEEGARAFRAFHAAASASPLRVSIRS